jgi:hypothetical protein
MEGLRRSSRTKGLAAGAGLDPSTSYYTHGHQGNTSIEARVKGPEEDWVDVWVNGCKGWAKELGKEYWEGRLPPIQRQEYKGGGDKGKWWYEEMGRQGLLPSMQELDEVGAREGVKGQVDQELEGKLWPKLGEGGEGQEGVGLLKGLARVLKPSVRGKTLDYGVVGGALVVKEWEKEGGGAGEGWMFRRPVKLRPSEATLEGLHAKGVGGGVEEVGDGVWMCMEWSPKAISQSRQVPKLFKVVGRGYLQVLMGQYKVDVPNTRLGPSGGARASSSRQAMVSEVERVWEYAHRLVLWCYEGPPPDQERVVAMHSCNNKLCLCPAHLFWGTMGENRKEDNVRAFQGRLESQSQGVKGV